MTLIGSGKMHDVYHNEWDTTVLKLPKQWNKLSLKKAEESLEFFQKNFSANMPETRILPDSLNRYTVEQSYINWVTLEWYLANWWSLGTLKNILLHFVNESISIIEKTWVRFDIIGTPQVNPMNIRKWSGCTNFLISNDWSLYFIDNVADISFWINPSLNRVLSKILIGRRRRIQEVHNLLSNLV